MRAMIAMEYMPSVQAGKDEVDESVSPNAFQLPANERCRSGKEPVTILGCSTEVRSSRRKAKCAAPPKRVMMRMMPSQKIGMETPTRAVTMPALSQSEYFS